MRYSDTDCVFDGFSCNYLVINIIVAENSESCGKIGINPLQVFKNRVMIELSGCELVNTLKSSGANMLPLGSLFVLAPHLFSFIQEGTYS